MQLNLRSRNVKELSMLPPDKAKTRRLAKYYDEIVLLDPKDYGEDSEDKDGDKVYERVKSLAQMLQDLASPSTRTLKCKGWYEDSGKSQFYLVYELPANSKKSTMPRSLLDLVYSSFKPSVSARIKLALLLCQTLSNIHQDNWLHKGIRSENVLFFAFKTGFPRTIDDPILSGFDFARKDGPNEYSEKPINASANLYRHPDALRGPSTTFTRLHDYYALGVVLVEIAVWRPIKKILEKHQELQGGTLEFDAAKKVRDILLDEDSDENFPKDIAFRMGEIYCKVVKTCLKGSFGVADERTDLLLPSFNSNVVAELSRCVI